jgi:hypothetical protein
MTKMARTAVAKRSRTGRSAARLELIRKRHQALILDPRKEIAADLDVETDHPLEDLMQEERLDFAEMIEVESL